MFAKTLVFLAVFAFVGAAPTGADGSAPPPLPSSSGNVRPWNPIKIGDGYSPDQPVPSQGETVDVFARLDVDHLSKARDVDYNDMPLLMWPWGSSSGDAHANEPLPSRRETSDVLARLHLANARDIGDSNMPPPSRPPKSWSSNVGDPFMNQPPPSRRGASDILARLNGDHFAKVRSVDINTVLAELDDFLESSIKYLKGAGVANNGKYLYLPAYNNNR